MGKNNARCGSGRGRLVIKNRFKGRQKAAKSFDMGRNNARRGSGRGRLVIKNRFKGRQKAAKSFLTEMPRKLLLLTNAERTIRYFGNGCSIEHVKRKGIKDFPSEHSISDISLVLDEDGTIIDDDDYLAAIPDETVIMILKPGEVWQSWLSADRISGSCGFVNAVDAALRYHKTGGLTPAESDRVRVLASRIRQQGLATFVTFSNDDIQLIAGMLPKDLAAVFGESEKELTLIQEACREHAAKRQAALDTVKRLKISKDPVTLWPYLIDSVDAVDHESLRSPTIEGLTPAECDRIRVLASYVRREGLAAVATFLHDDFQLIAYTSLVDLTAVFGMSMRELMDIQDECNLYAASMQKAVDGSEVLKMYKAALGGDAQSTCGN